MFCACMHTYTKREPETVQSLYNYETCILFLLFLVVFLKNWLLNQIAFIECDYVYTVKSQIFSIIIPVSTATLSSVPIQ